jgi:RNA polymerase sigma-70 factor (ECF subfamily)
MPEGGGRFAGFESTALKKDAETVEGSFDEEIKSPALRTKLFNFVKRHLVDDGFFGQNNLDHIADDIVQNTFIKAIKAQESFRGEAKIINWMISIAINEIKMKKRAMRAKKNRTVSYDSMMEDGKVIDKHASEEDLLGVEEIDKLVKQIKNEQYRKILTALARGDDHEEIARDLGINYKHVKVLVSRARAELRELYRKETE